MECKNCKTMNLDNSIFCQNCGSTLEGKTNIVNEFPKKNRSGKKLLFIMIISVIILAVIISTVLIIKNDKKEDVSDNNQTDDSDIVSVLETPLDKLKSDYESGKIDVNKYFTELVYMKYDSSKLDKKYYSSSFLISGSSLNLIDILIENKDKISSDIANFYLMKETLSDVSLGFPKAQVEQQINHSNNYEVTFLNDQSSESNHILDKVKLSNNGNFLVWYTTTGDDAITESEAQQVADGLENAISVYEQEFSIPYSYDPYVDKNSLFASDYRNAFNALEDADINPDKMYTTMSVYIFDTGSVNELAAYRSPADIKKILNSLFGSSLNNDGIINYPYIVINKRGFANSSDNKEIEKNENLEQLYAHELFHHFQYLHCSSITCKTSGIFMEASANYASAIASNSEGTDNFLNDWAGIYSTNTSNYLPEIDNSSGYALFPYLYSYSKIVANGKHVIREAHTVIDPFQYLQDKTSQENLIKVINDLAFYTLTQGYDNNCLKSNDGIRFKEAKLSSGDRYSQFIQAGSIDYYVLEKNSTIAFTSSNSNITFNVYGYIEKPTVIQNQYTLITSDDRYSYLAESDYANFDKVYIAVTNASLTMPGEYKLEVNGKTKEETEKKDEVETENKVLVTTFKNYNVDITTNFVVSGISSTTSSKGIIDQVNQKEYLETTTSSFGFVVSTNKSYTDFKSGITYTSQPYSENIWYKQQGTSQMVDLNVIIKQINTMKNVTKIADNHYKIKLSGDNVSGLTDSANLDSSSLAGNVEVDVYITNGYITKLEYDFSTMTNELSSMFESFTTTVLFSNYDNAGSVNIPNDVIKNAKS